MSYAKVKRVASDLWGGAWETERGVREPAGPSRWRGLAPAATIINGLSRTKARWMTFSRGGPTAVTTTIGYAWR
jgi:hypothetical protein